MNTREENVAAAMREAEEIEHSKQLHQADLRWAKRWHEGDARCPVCGGTNFGLPEVIYEGHLRYESVRCITPRCEGRWELELREIALAVVRKDGPEDGWIELDRFNPDQPLDLSARERALLRAALCYWRREGALSAGHERDIETDHGHLQPLSEPELDRLAERLERPDRHSDSPLTP